MFQIARSQSLPRERADVLAPSARARIARYACDTFIDGQAKQRRRHVQGHEQRGIGEVPGLLSVAIAIGRLCRRNVSTGGNCLSRSYRTRRATARDLPARATRRRLLIGDSR